jgi:protein-tyrosine phosphatase
MSLTKKLEYCAFNVFDYMNFPNMAAYVFFDPGAEVVPGIFIGSLSTAQNSEWLAANKIDTIVNVSARQYASTIQQHDILLYDIDITPELMGVFMKSFDLAAMIISSERNLDHRVLVHCAQGVNRSAMCIAWYLMYTGHKYEQIIQMLTVANIRRDMPVLTNMSFRRLLATMTTIAGIKKNV